ncbi:PREDICTED: uncharacterized protein LOC109147127 [Ipomoea nil]|uniref:uncharacterized protein LOC109147127 n=1 Tax=Ipomoea nil TaxID=35883 RepID=UPI00090154CB|nr:PREDICTED: uncharacterized protein LOC109147127 [Ipomoea nil]
MPTVNFEAFNVISNRLIQEELSYDCVDQEKENQELVRQLTEEQNFIYNEVLTDIDRKAGGLFFVYGYGGTGKTFLWRALSSALRSKREIVLNVASSGIASLLLPGGRTAHSRFVIPISVNEDSTCNISHGSPLAELIVQSKQILPVIPKGTRQDIVRASISSSSYLWKSWKVFRLTNNLRLRSVQSQIEGKEIEEFAKWIANIGDITIGNSSDDSTNQYMNDHNPAEGRTYLSCDSVCKSDSNVDMLADLHTPEFLNDLRCSGVPNHALTLKVGSPVMFLRNIDHTLGLCNDTRLIVTRLADHVLEAKIMCGQMQEQEN